MNTVGETKIFDNDPSLASIRFHFLIEHIKIGWRLGLNIFYVLEFYGALVKSNYEKLLKDLIFVLMLNFLMLSIHLKTHLPRCLLDSYAFSDADICGSRLLDHVEWDSHHRFL